MDHNAMRDITQDSIAIDNTITEIAATTTATAAAAMPQLSIFTRIRTWLLINIIKKSRK
jgi:hypothetical protein